MRRKLQMTISLILKMTSFYSMLQFLKKIVLKVKLKMTPRIAMSLSQKKNQLKEKRLLRMKTNAMKRIVQKMKRAMKMLMKVLHRELDCPTLLRRNQAKILLQRKKIMLIILALT